MLKTVILLCTLTSLIACEAPYEKEIKKPKQSYTNSKVQQATSDSKAGCVNRGIEYFKEIGSYPTLSNGRDAATVASERCGRTLTAFPK